MNKAYVISGFVSNGAAGNAASVIRRAARRFGISCSTEIRQIGDGTWSVILRFWTKEEARDVISAQF